MTLVCEMPQKKDISNHKSDQKMLLHQTAVITYIIHVALIKQTPMNHFWLTSADTL